ncbi:glutathione S-transferase [Litoreibacter ponti]|uniref:Glutathione S-transferase n=1 Tax=Litoreibacter ponti TaxID=1510457 RepID=A0A2T6BP88_9RHOB|nr:glutathione S-transferase [Litoreibacter ponti]PTX57862.1 glutathione S-transferase [Litoreibacter ponti]
MTPVLYSFRRCPYAMRARLALYQSGLVHEHREIVLRDKAPEFIAASAKATVPVLVLRDMVLEESLDIMRWALVQNDPDAWLEGDDQTLIHRNDTQFKHALDRYKYASRYGEDPLEHRRVASEILHDLDTRLAETTHLIGDDPKLADIAIFPFIRQFANTDRPWFDAQDWPQLQRWLAHHLDHQRFAAIMGKYPKWQAGDPPTLAPAKQCPQG